MCVCVCVCTHFTFILSLHSLSLAVRIKRTQPVQLGALPQEGKGMGWVGKGFYISECCEVCITNGRGEGKKKKSILGSPLILTIWIKMVGKDHFLKKSFSFFSFLLLSLWYAHNAGTGVTGLPIIIGQRRSLVEIREINICPCTEDWKRRILLQWFLQVSVCKYPPPRTTNLRKNTDNYQNKWVGIKSTNWQTALLSRNCYISAYTYIYVCVYIAHTLKCDNYFGTEVVSYSSSFNSFKAWIRNEKIAFCPSKPGNTDHHPQ